MRIPVVLVLVAALAWPAAAAAGATATGAASAASFVRLADAAPKGSAVHLPKAFRKRLDRAATLTARAVTRGVTRASGAQKAPVVERVDLPETSESRDGVTITTSGEAVRRADGSADVSVRTEMTDGERTVRFTPAVRGIDESDTTVGCPTAEGAVEAKDVVNAGGSYVVLRGRRVLGAAKEEFRTTWKAVGRVGTDAHLQDVSVEATWKATLIAGGEQRVLTSRSAVSGGPTGALRSTAYAAEATVKVAGQSAAADRREERALERRMRQDDGYRRIAERLAEEGRRTLAQAEPGWYDLPGACASIVVDPADARLPAKATRTYNADVRSTDGDSAEGTVAVDGVGYGSLEAVRASTGPGAPATLRATGADKPNDLNQTVRGGLVATSRAGRASRFFVRTFEPPEVPARFTGAVVVLAGDAARRHEFAGYGVYDRTSVQSFPDGSTTAYYALTTASLTQAKDAAPPSGCRYEAEGTGGFIDSGDIEIRILPDGQVVYALLYDVRLPETYSYVDCPAPVPPSFEGDISAVLNTAPSPDLATRFRPVGPNWKLYGLGASDVQVGPGFTDVSAGWDFNPG